MRIVAAVLAFLVCGLLSGKVLAADGGWSLQVAPYLWAVGIDGDVEVGDREVDVDVGFDDLIDKVDFGGSLLARVQKDLWVSRLQVDYFELSEDENVDRIGGAKVEVDSDTLFLTVATGIQFPWLRKHTIDVLGGVRYAHMDNELKIAGVGSRDNTQDIFDGILMLRPSFRLSQRWYFNPTFSIGAGDSDLTWELQPQFQFNFADNWGALIGYRRLYYDVEGDRGNSFDGAFHGFMLGLGGGF
ncbi:MAG: outer membrane beta-barrel protein [Syntrophotaleaceae bacterium]